MNLARLTTSTGHTFMRLSGFDRLKHKDFVPAQQPAMSAIPGVTRPLPGRGQKLTIAAWRAALAGCLVPLTLALSTANAPPSTWDFTSTVQTPSNGNATLTGTFTIDPNTTVTSFDFITPVGNITPANFTASIQLFTPAFNPNADFVDLLISDKAGDVITMYFETSLVTFSGADAIAKQPIYSGAQSLGYGIGQVARSFFSWLEPDQIECRQ